MEALKMCLVVWPSSNKPVKCKDALGTWDS